MENKLIAGEAKTYNVSKQVGNPMTWNVLFDGDRVLDLTRALEVIEKIINKILIISVFAHKGRQSFACF